MFLSRCCVQCGFSRHLYLAFFPLYTIFRSNCNGLTPLGSSMTKEVVRAGAHFSREVRQHLNVVTFEQQCIGLGGLVHWPARSPDLSCINFFFYDHMEAKT
ncbi:hypothetical protein AVEN_185922-1 [Araneus ventricosus]|uniref:Uncharacterized protein n=1 Tax=Araneus ventricosus TaxID=182803 RepID=A0A4Y2KDV3_ARAVE|nr:hypothetical protein AVEN_185922-1 [Araneus ventricosus]